MTDGKAREQARVGAGERERVKEKEIGRERKRARKREREKVGKTERDRKYGENAFRTEELGKSRVNFSAPHVRKFLCPPHTQTLNSFQPNPYIAMLEGNRFLK